MTDPDTPMPPCAPVCDFEQEGELVVCNDCGTLWRRQIITEVDPHRGWLPVRQTAGWVRL